MNTTLKYEKRMLLLVYLLCLALFTNIAVKQTPIDKMAFIIAGILIIIIGFSHFIIRKFYPDGDKYMLIFASVLAVVGIAILYRLDHKLAMKQLVWFISGIAVYMGIVIVLPDLKSFAKYKYIYMVGTLVFMAMSMVIGSEINGAKNWVFIGSFGFQPSEIGKIFLILYLAAALMNYEKKNNIKDEFKQLLEPALVVMYSLGFMVLQRDLGSALMFFFVSITMLYIATCNWKYVTTGLGLFAIGGTASYYLFGHVRNRIKIWKDVWKYANKESFQIVQGFYAMSLGGMFGVGLYNGYPKLVPFRSTDFIFTLIAQELGLVFGIGLLLLYFLLFYRGIRAALNTDDPFSQLNAVGFSTLIVAQVLVIIGGVFSVIPLTGITLPLVSYGGTSMLTVFIALGILQKISEEGLR
ncbi:TPA: FtsW/RodA/SpoVE family cell cycle protein [Clostridium perfringens]|uniref:FtsW/RodA/SpoVE family cell cycle protein n=1 Tax=Clostridium perfringens TaxID=1502 RepID=UPI000F525EB4|nr:FtsW/RodA/SpoVE family cell cycle protein [Clostridium perfringens]EJT6341856.1 FtsW/RodA/SpoVE family cell cycle protein [Clostridium perfringens]ELQ0172263.1 FtsW/RodA/SpoVE family cell cycle protein [Clostridium perfringens]MDU1966664.1 FtsW/RodA/SpoVE family cell cycle protein [Clostridium perfringens]MDU7726147.1 FtsW/RodA/SpoVE family cell cycle protein [Clostridium perfringens]UBK98015.1 FtsW/RodA/SpoVE family cell cycle protein [Clostridium perfringens]